MRDEVVVGAEAESSAEELRWFTRVVNVVQQVLNYISIFALAI